MTHKYALHFSFNFTTRRLAVFIPFSNFFVTSLIPLICLLFVLKQYYVLSNFSPFLPLKCCVILKSIAENSNYVFTVMIFNF